MRKTFAINHSIQKINLFLISGLILLFGLLGLYIFQINEITKGMFSVKNYNKKLENLLQENKILEIKFSQLSSLENLGLLVAQLNFDEAGKIDYIKIPEEVVVIK